MIRPLTAMTVTLALTGCAAILATSGQLVYHDQVFEPRRKPAEVDVVGADQARRPYVTLGRVMATQGMFGSRESVMAELRRRAAALGADALIDLTVTGGVGQPNAGSETTRFAQSGYVSTSESWTPEGRAAIRITISALAIRYETP